MTVRVYRSTDNGAPVLSGQVGALIGVLDACLVNGYGSLSITSLTQSGGVATATTSAPHGWVNSPKVNITGATQSGYNVEATATVTGASTFTYPVNSGTVSPATGAPVVGRKGSGWTKPWTGTNLASYKQPAGSSNGFSLRVDDNTVANVARIVGYESMTDVNTGTNPFPTTAQFSGGLYAFKSSTSDSTARAWVLVCNGPMFYFFNNQASQASWTTSNGIAFGDITSYKSGDAYGTLIIGNDNNVSTSNRIQSLSSTDATATPGHYMCRAYTQTGSAVTAATLSDYAKANSVTTLGSGGLTYPNPADGGLYVAPVFLSENALTSLRGVLPGIWNPLHNAPLSQGDIWIPTGDLNGKTLEAMNTYNSSQLFFETSDTW